MTKEKLFMLAAKFKTLAGAQKRAAFESVHNARGFYWHAQKIDAHYRVCRFSKGE